MFYWSLLYFFLFKEVPNIFYYVFWLRSQTYTLPGAHSNPFRWCSACRRLRCWLELVAWELEAIRLFVYDFLKLLQVTKIVNNYYFCQRISYFLYNFWTLRARFNVAVPEHPALDVVQYWLCHAQLCAHVCLHFQGYQNYRHIKCVCFNCIPIAKITFRGEVKPNR